MADNFISIELLGLKELENRFKLAVDKIPNDMDTMLDVANQNIASEAKALAPVDRGDLAGVISADNSRLLSKRVSVNVFYAAYIEFGIGAYAAQYVSSLPQEWQQFASQYRGKTGGTFAEMIIALTEWVHRKGIAGTFSVKSQRRTGNKSTQAIQDKQAAYRIARKILKDGIRAHPFLYPAYIKEQPLILENANKILNSI